MGNYGFFYLLKLSAGCVLSRQYIATLEAHGEKRVTGNWKMLSREDDEDVSARMLTAVAASSVISVL